jgi:PAS domain S-box-containing protein
MGDRRALELDSGGALMRSEGLKRALRGILITALVGSGIGLVIAVLYDDAPAKVVGVGGLLGLPVVGWLLARGHVTAASLGLLGLFDALTVYALVFGGGVQDPTAMLFPVMIIASGVLLDRRVSLAASIVLVASCIGVGVAELAGLVDTRLSHMLSTSDVLFLAMLIVIVAVLVQVMSRALRDSIQRVFYTDQSYQEVFNATSEGIIVHDAETGEIVDVNDSALAMFGVSSHARDGFTIDALVGAGAQFDRATLDARLAHAGEDPSSFEWCAPGPDGAPVWMDVTLRAARIRGRDRVVSVLRDISERRVLQEQVQQAEKLRAVGHLARGVAHDFNNQLTVILANASLLEEGVQADPDLAEYTQAIIESSRRSADLTQQLLAFARKGQRQLEPIDVDVLVEDVRVLLARSIDKRIEVVHVRSHRPAIIHGDASFLQNALLNLGLNARDAMPEGGTLRLEVEGPPLSGDAAERAVILRVRDTGCGMPKDVVPHIFEPFYTTRSEGNGMGLAAVYGTVVAHEGTIVVESEPGVGTTFTITLPAASQDEVAAGPAPEESVAARHAGIRVLLAEDEAMVAKVAARILAQLGCEVTHCADGDAAIEALRADANGFDVALLDHSMPGMTGSEVLQAMRGLGIEIPVIGMSGYTEASPSPVAHRPDAFLSKPFDRAALSETLEIVLADRRS